MPGYSELFTTKRSGITHYLMKTKPVPSKLIRRFDFLYVRFTCSFHFSKPATAMAPPPKSLVALLLAGVALGVVAFGFWTHPRSATLMALHANARNASARTLRGAPSSTVAQHVSILPMDTRLELGHLLERMGLTTGAELGVQRGLFSASVLSRWPSCKRYLLVDLWEQQENYFVRVAASMRPCTPLLTMAIPPPGHF